MERLHKRKLISLLCSFLVALSAGSNYGFSSYSPQLQERLHLTSTQINVVGMMGNMGVYLSGPLWGKLVDRRGPKRALAIGSVLIFVGYGGLSLLYEGRLLKTSSLFLLALLSFLEIRLRYRESHSDAPSRKSPLAALITCPLH